jgi:peptidoglycan/xylan/chitin deacetylase (PgdA/CDA1 family)
MFHAVGDRRDDPRRDLVQSVDASLFESQVRYLKLRYRLVAASELLEAATARRRGERFPLALTFDDDLPSHVAITAPILRRHRVPATFFLCGAGLAGPHRFWWERLQALFDAGGLTRPMLDTLGLPNPAGDKAERLTRLDRLAEAIEEMKPDDRAALDRRLESLLGPDPPGSGLRGHQVKELADHGFEIGFHTQTHDRLTQLTPMQLGRALRDGRAELGSHVGYEPSVLAYPHCRADARVATAAAEAGYTYAFTCSPGPVGAGTNPMLMPRLIPSSRSTGHLAAQAVRALFRRAVPNHGA